jgi:precorrin-6A/cobalt-precorrin-6A reductase
VSLAGRTAAPVEPPLPFRIGGFGGVDGLASYLREHGVGAVIDATHPFAARMSVHAVEACRRLGLPLIVFSRAPWRPGPGDRWTSVPDLPAAAAALGPRPLQVFLTSGRLGLAAFKAAPQHRYLGRTIDPPAPADLPPHYRAILARGPFPVAEETALLREEAIEVLVTKNSGGTASDAKLDAARRLGLPVIMVEPPPPTEATRFTDLPAVLDWIAAQRDAP